MKQDLTKHTLFLNTGDYRKLAEIYPESHPSVIIRALISNHIAKASPAFETSNIEVDKINV